MRSRLLDMRKRTSSRWLGYVLVGAGLALLVIAWINSYPLGTESRASYLYDSIYPTFWPGLILANVGIFFVAIKSSSVWERFGCGLLFFMLAYSIKYYFAFLHGPDIGMFEGLTESFVSNRLLVPEQHDYYQWPMLFILGTELSDIIGASVNSVTDVLFFAFTLLFTCGIFLYTTQRNNSNSFLLVVAYVLAAYPYLNWQYAAWTYGFCLLPICLKLMVKPDRSHRVVLVILYVALIFAHAFLAVFLILSSLMMAIKNRKYTTIALSFTLLYGTYLAFRAVILVQDFAAGLTAALLLEYAQAAEVTISGSVTALDALAQLVSRSLTLSIWGVLGVLILFSLIRKKLRDIDISVAVGGSLYAIAGAIVPVLGLRAFQMLVLPTLDSLSSFLAGTRLRKILLAYFLVALAIFPLALVHFYYDDINYMTVGERHAADVMFIAAYDGGANTDFEMMVRTVMSQYLDSKSEADTWYITEHDEHPQLLLGAGWFKFIFMSPELEHGLVSKAGLSASEVSRLEAGTALFSRVYSNGRAVILMNSNVTELPEIEW